MIRSRVTYDKQRADLSDPNYRILYELARDRQTEVPLVRLNVSCEANVEIHPAVQSENRLSIYMHVFDPAGNTTWKGFDLAFLLSPESGTLRFQVSSKRDLREIRNSASRKIIFQNRSAYLETTLPEYDRSQDTLLIRLEQVQFDLKSADQFVNATKMIDKYFQSASLLDSLMAKVSRHQTHLPVITPEAYVDILMLNKAVNLIKEDPITDSLVHFSSDAAHLAPGLQNAARTAKSMAFTFSDRLHDFNQQPVAASLDLYANYFVDRISWCVRQSVKLEQSGGGLFRDYLEHFFTLEGFPDDRTVFLRMAESLYPNKSAEASALVLSYEVFYAYRNKAQEMLDLHEFAEAVLLIKHANLFIASNPWMTEKPDLSIMLIEAYKGIYDSYLSIAAAGLEHRRYVMAWNYLDKARLFREGAPVPIPADSVYGSLSLQLSLLSNEVPLVPEVDTIIPVPVAPEPEVMVRQEILPERPAVVYDRRCIDLREEAEVLMIRAERNIQSGRYVAAIDQLRSVKAIGDTAVSCEIRIPGTEDSLAKYMPAYEYLVLKQEMSNNIALGFFATAVDQVFKLNKDHSEKNLSYFGLEPVSLTAEILDRLSQSLCIATIDKYLRLGSCPEALTYIRLFQQIGGTSAMVADYQQQTAACLALIDYKKQNGGFLVEAIRQYNLEGTWFKPFRSAYQKTWSELDNKNNPGQPFLPE